MCQLGNLKRYLIKPEYIFRPSQGVRRILRRLKPRPRSAVVELPWKLQLCIRLDDHIGWSIWRTGVYDLCVTEVLWRLIDKGETSVDVGANIGHMTSVMVKRVGASGKVHAYEAHPEVQELDLNPMFAYPDGTIAVDARIVVSES